MQVNSKSICKKIINSLIFPITTVMCINSVKRKYIYNCQTNTNFAIKQQIKKFNSIYKEDYCHLLKLIIILFQNFSQNDEKGRKSY